MAAERAEGDVTLERYLNVWQSTEGALKSKRLRLLV